jgi:signal transduction histidine kinase
MFRVLPDQENPGERLFDFPSEQLIAAARIFLALFALIAVAIETVPANRIGQPTFTVLGAYLGFALLQGILVLRRLPSRGEQIFAHAFDVGAVSGLMALTEGPTSPFFVFFIFILISSTLRWNWQGALVTAALLIAAYGALVLSLQPELSGPDDLTRAIIRAAFLMVAGAMLGYVGAYRERSRRRLAQLVAWPGPDRTSKASPPIRAALAHAAALLRAPRILVIWEQPEEPFQHVALFSEGDVRHAREPSGRFGTLVAQSHAKASFLVDVAGQEEASRATKNHLAPPLIDRSLCAAFGLRRVLTAPFQRDLCRGRVFVMDPSGSTDDDLLLVELIAGRLGVDLEHYLLRHQIQAAAAMSERERLGRDLHDGLLQSLAAATIQIKLSANRADGDVAAQLEETRALLADEQQRIRRFVEDHRPVRAAPAGEVDLAAAVSQRLKDLGRQWCCEVNFEASPSDLKLPAALARDVRHLLGEAVSNAARHGPASRVHITIARSSDNLSIGITDDGRGFQGLCGHYEDDELKHLDVGPASLRSRVGELGGTLVLETSPDGSRIDVRLPV